MAVVRITQNLRDYAIGRARKIFSDKINAIHAEPLPSGWTADTIYTTALGQWHADMVKLPPEFFLRLNHISVLAIGSYTTKEMKLPSSTPMPVPSKFPEGHYVKTRSPYSSDQWIILDVPNSPFASLVTEYEARQKRIDALTTQSDTLVEGVAKVLTARTTLAPALRAWPALWDLLPDNAKEAHKRISSKKSEDKQELDVDTSVLTAVLAASKMGL